MMILASVLCSGQTVVTPHSVTVISDGELPPSAKLIRHAMLREIHRSTDWSLPAADKLWISLPALDALEEAERIHEDARRHFDNLEMEEAARLYKRALAILEKAAPTTGCFETWTKTMSHLAGIYLLLGQEKRARSLLARLLRVAPQTKPDTAVFNPQMAAVFEGVAAEVRGRRHVRLTLSTDPPEAIVLLDGQLVGSSPAMVEDVAVGQHFVTVFHPRREPFGERIEVGRRNRGTLSFRLDEPPSDPARDALRSKAKTAEELGEGLMTSGEVQAVLVLSADNERLHSRALLLNGADAEGESVAHAQITTMARAEAAAREILDAFRTSLSFEEATEPKQSLDLNVSTGPAKRNVLWVTYGGAAALALGGAIVGTFALTSERTYYREETRDTPSAPIDHDQTTDQVEGESIASRGRNLARTADMLLAASAAMALTGALLHILWDDSPEAPSASATAEPVGPSLNIGPLWLQLRF